MKWGSYVFRPRTPKTDIYSQAARRAVETSADIPGHNVLGGYESRTRNAESFMPTSRDNSDAFLTVAAVEAFESIIDNSSTDTSTSDNSSSDTSSDTSSFDGGSGGDSGGGGAGGDW